MHLLRRLGQRSVSRYFSDPSLVFEVHIVRKSHKNNLCVSSDRKPQGEVFALLHQFSLPALTASVTKSSLLPVLTLDAMLDLAFP